MPACGAAGFNRVGQAGADAGELGDELARDCPVDHAGRAEADADPFDAGQLVLEAGAEVDVVRAVLEQDEAGRMLRQAGGSDLVIEIAGLLGWHRALSVPATCCPPGRRRPH